MAEEHSLILKVDSRQVKQGEKDLNSLSNSANKTEKSTNGVTSSFLSLGRVLSATALIGTTAQFIKLADTMTGIESKLKLVTKSTMELKIAQQELFTISQNTRQSYDATVSTYSNFALAMGEMGKSQKDILRVTETVNKAIAISGGTAQQAAAATMQLGQAFASGTLRGDELNSILENSKGLAKAIADGMGVPIGKLRTLGSEGKITAEILATALEKSAQSVDEKFGKVGITVEASMTVASNSLTKIVGELNSATGATSSLSEEITGFSKSIDDNTESIVNFGRFSVATIDRTIDMFKMLGGFAVNTAEYALGGISTIYYGVMSPITSGLLTVTEGLNSIGLSSDKTLNNAKVLANSMDKNLKLSRKSMLDDVEDMDNLINAASDTVEERVSAMIKRSGAIKDLKGGVNSGGKKGVGTTETEKERKARLKDIEEEAKIQKGYLESYAELQANQALEDYNNKIGYLESYADMEAKAAIDKFNAQEEIRQTTLSEAEKINEKMMALAESGGLDFNSAPMIAFFEEMNKQLENAVEKVKEFDSFKLEFDAESLEGTPKAIAAVGKSLDKLAQADKKYNEKKALYKEGTEEFNKNEQEHTSNQIIGYSNLAGAMSTMFQEGSKEAQAMQAVQASLAMVEATLAVVHAGTGGDVYTAIPRMIATAAVAANALSNIGKSFSGGGSAPTLPKSTVLGAKAGTESESTTNIVDILEEAHASEYSELRDINRAVTSMAQGIESAVANIFKSGILDTSGIKLSSSGGAAESTMNFYSNTLGKLVDKTLGGDKLTQSLMGATAGLLSKAFGGIFGGSSKQYIAGSGFDIAGGSLGSKAGGNIGASTYVDVETMKKKAWGSASYSHNITTTALDAASSQSISLIYKSFSDTMMEINKGLGTSLAPAISNYTLDAIKISTAGLSGEEVIKTLNDRFSALGDKMTNDIFGRILSQYQDLGEGLLETAVRVITEKAVVMSNLKDINKSIYGDTIAITQSLVDLAGGLTDFSDDNESYYDKYFSDAEKQVKLQAKLSESFSYLGVRMPTTIEGFRKIVEGTDLSTLAGRELFTGLMGLSEGFAELQDNIKNTDLSGLLDDIKAFVSSLRAEIVPMSTSTSFTTFSKSFNDMISAIASGSSNLSEIGTKAIDNARAYIDTVTATSSAGRDIAFAKAVVANKFEAVTLAPNITMGTVNDTLKFSLGEQSYIVTELRAMRQELITANQLGITQTANSINQLSATRALLPA